MGMGVVGSRVKSGDRMGGRREERRDWSGPGVGGIEGGAGTRNAEAGSKDELELVDRC